MPNARTLAPPLLAVFALGLLGYATWLTPALSPMDLGVTGLLALVGVATLVSTTARRDGLRTGLSCFLLASMLVMLVARLTGHQLLSVSLIAEPRYGAFLGALLALSIVGLWRGWLAAHWLALALGTAGVVSSGLNLGPWIFEHNPWTWILAMQLAGALLLVANLYGRDLSAAEQNASALWTSQDPVLRSLRWTVVFHFAAIPMLLVYAWVQPIVPATAAWAVGLAAFLSVSVAAALSRRVIGAVGLVLGGAGLLILTGATSWGAHSAGALYGQISLYYAIFWVPAGIAAVVCGLRLARPVLALLRD